ncbi:MAG TPA: hypothetical protein VFB32_01525 [Rudaea sp.]|nr:hypothetical protein [Rudaea sp.]
MFMTHAAAHRAPTLSPSGFAPRQWADFPMLSVPLKRLALSGRACARRYPI